jgi:hypothetical protein
MIEGSYNGKEEIIENLLKINTSGKIKEIK